tara:strand:- start:254 stop:397 length:144 start_codon:yes stop_codon:yes gene_type:complete
MAIDKINLPQWAGDDWSPKEGMEEDLETMVIIAMKKINEVIDWINTQ